MHVFSLSGSISSLNAISLITSPSMMINGSDGIGSVSSEFINTGMNGTSG
jgi:hypothetical protein